MEPLSNNGVNNATGNPHVLGGSVDIKSNGVTHICYPQMEFGLNLNYVGTIVGFSSNYKTLFVLASAPHNDGYYVCVYGMVGTGWSPMCYTYSPGTTDDVELSCITLPYGTYLVVRDRDTMTAYTVENNVSEPLSVNIEVSNTANAAYAIYRSNAGGREEVEELKESARAYMAGVV